MSGNQGTTPAALPMEINSQNLGSDGSLPNAVTNPLMTSTTQLERVQDLASTSQADFTELESIKVCLNTCQDQIQPGSQLLQAINALVWKLELVLKEKHELIMADNARTSNLFQNAPSTAASTAQSAYETEEEELEQETGWTTQDSRKSKRKRKNTPPKQKPPRRSQPPKQKEETIKKPPPIKVDTQDVKKITEIAHASSGEGNFAVKTLNNKTVKINCDDADGYRKLVSQLKTEDFSYYTYENKQTRPVRVVAKGLHHQWEEKEIYDDLIAKGFKIESVSKKLSAKTKAPLNMFVLSFSHDENVDSIYKLTKIMHNVVEICPLRGGKLVPQCKKCQDFGHTRNHCNKKPRCVKCGKGHITAECTKPAKTRATCANCKGDHPANYRGCTVAKEAQTQRKLQKKALTAQNTRSNQSTRSVQNNVNQAQKPQVQRQVQQGTINPSAQLSWAKVASTRREDPTQIASQDMGSMLTLILNEVQSVKLTVSTLTKRVEAMELRQNPGRKSKPST